ncbi:hypothetical protein BDM02DRAFT_3106748 [Thelephora ganbajun]|uniref:Uncharacterized protein n=1 Tax=Thelephora ganbajun TaxID=370292 RepID=A0ACB6ZY72_THEGA|nr:hypothetical protein BDM02DRAFT_3106748 [Thelephora ganbajun]
MLTEVIAVPLSQHALLIQDLEGPRSVESFTPYTDNPDTAPSRDHTTYYHKYAFAVFLLALATPSLWMHTIPNPTYTTTTTPFSLGCALPQTHLPQRTPHSPTLDDYITETKKMTNAKLVLWPERVLQFNTDAERNTTFEKIYNNVLEGHKGLHVGVGFEETVPDSWSKRTSK